MLGDDARPSDHRIRYRREENGTSSNSALHQRRSKMQDAEEDDRRWPVLERTALRHGVPLLSSARALRWAPRRHDNRQRRHEGPTMSTARTTCTGQVRGAWMLPKHRHSPQVTRFITIAAKSSGRFSESSTRHVLLWAAPFVLQCGTGKVDKKPS